MSGPCLCGDPYCPSCGDPSLAKLEGAIEKLCDKLYEMQIDEYELQIFQDVGFKAIESFREVVKDAISERTGNDDQYIAQLEEQVRELIN